MYLTSFIIDVFFNYVWYYARYNYDDLLMKPNYIIFYKKILKIFNINKKMENV
jgi:hypothetical protein